MKHLFVGLLNAKKKHGMVLIPVSCVVFVRLAMLPQTAVRGRL